MSSRTLGVIAAIVITSTLAACGGGGGSSPATPPANRAPVASDLSLGTNPATPVTGALSATDPDGDPLTFTASTPNSGTLVLSGAGNRDFEYTPDAGFVGSDSFTFTASDGALDSNTAVVVLEVNQRPTAVGASYTTSDLATVAGMVTGSDPEADPLSFVVVSSPSKGSLTSFNATTGAFVYRPNPAMDGVDTFGISATDGFQRSIPAEVDIEIFKWAGTQQFGSSADDGAATGSMFINADGSMVLAGYTDGSVAGVPGSGNRDSWIRKVDRRGVEIWTKQFDALGGQPRHLSKAPQGDDFFLVEGGSGRVFRFDTNGNEIWQSAVDVGPSTASYLGYQGNVDSAGNVYVISWIESAFDSRGGFALSIFSGADGSLLGQRIYSASVDDVAASLIPDTLGVFARGVDFDDQDRPVIVGRFRADPAGQPRSCSNCQFVAALDASGDVLWIHEPVSYINDCSDSGATADLHRVSVASDGSIYAIGANFHGAGVSGTVSRLAADGSAELWSRCEEMPASAGNVAYVYMYTPILEAANGDMLLLRSEEIWDDGQTVKQSSNTIVSRITPGGNELWRRSIPSSIPNGSPGFSFPGSIVEDADQLLYLSGTVDGEMTIAPSAGGEDVFLQRLGSDGVLH